MNKEKYLNIYRSELFDSVLPFWFPRSIDFENKGYYTALGRDGERLQNDKPVWFQGRVAWMLATLYNTVEQRPEWLEWARYGIEFLEENCIDEDGRYFFLMTEKGKSLRKRRYIFSEIFAISAYAAYGIAIDSDRYKQQALDLLNKVVSDLRTPGALQSKWSDERPMKGLVIPMVLIVTAQEERKAIAAPELDQLIDQCILEVEKDFIKPEFDAVLEIVGPNGEFIDTFEGRMITPGHSIELGWFILEEARLRGNDPKLIKLGTRIIDLCWKQGWDEEFGGMLYYTDAKKLSPTEYWHDMKFWWPHNETIIATLLAYELTGDEKYAQWHQKIHDWTYSHFPDQQHGEWFGYLHRDGSVSTELKGNIWKGFFHLPRMLWYCSNSIERIIKIQNKDK